jgi:hypothetical protein
MSVRINPCHGCPLREGCDQRDEFRRKVRGLGLRSATFRCQRLDDGLRKGRRIMISTPQMRDRGSSYNPDYCVEMVAVPATITSSYDGMFTCVIDPGHVYGRVFEDAPAGEDVDKYRFRRRMKAQRIIKFLDEPDMALCDTGRVVRNGQCDRTADEVCYCAEATAFR